MDYTLRGPNSKPVVAFECPHCVSPLESPLEEAGQTFNCPNCGGAFVTPGEKEWNKRLARLEAEEQARRKEEAEKYRAADALREAEIERRRKGIEARQRAEREEWERQQRLATTTECENCEQPIGKLEPRDLYDNHVVCASCFAKLTAAHSSMNPAAPQRIHVTLGRGDVICPNPNCGFVGPGSRQSKGSGLVLIVLLLFWILPGLLYFVFYYGYSINCPRCGVKIRDD